jgi:hypothetical protein
MMDSEIIYCGTPNPSTDHRSEGAVCVVQYTMGRAAVSSEDVASWGRRHVRTNVIFDEHQSIVPYVSSTEA